MDNIWKIKPFVYLIALLPLLSYGQGISFDDSDPDKIILDNGSDYEIAFHKNTGSLIYIHDLGSDVVLTIGHEMLPLWWALYNDGSEVFSRQYNPESADKFSYSWDETTNTLSLIYNPDQQTELKITAEVTIKLSLDNYFDLQLHLNNEGGKTIKEVGFHHQMGVTLESGDRMLIPYGNPGLMLGSDFIASRENMIYDYPGYGSDYLGLLISDIPFSIYTLRDGMEIISTSLGLEADFDEGTPQNYAINRTYICWVENDSSWTSPVSRFRIGQDFQEALTAYRVENGIDQFPSLAEKHGENYEVLSRAPIYNYAFPPWEPPGFVFSEFAPMLEPFPTPSIMFLISYYMYGFPGYSPDYLPPVPFLGTTDDFKAMVASLQAQNRLVMPFTHSVYWHDQSPTLLNLPGNISLQDVALINPEGKIDSMMHWNGQFELFDKYYSVSPYSPFVQERLEEVYNNIFEVYGCDLMYQDVIGTVGAIYDFNAYMPNPTYFRHGWLEYLKQHQNYPSIIEGGYDRLTEFVPGFMVSNQYIDAPGTEGWDYDIDDGYSRSFPINPFICSDKTAYYSWGSDQTNIRDITAWSLLFACPLSVALRDIFPWQITEETEMWPWCWLSHEFQYHVVSKMMGRLMDEYTDLDGAATQAVYGDIKAIRNWHEENSYVYGEHTIAPRGTLVTGEEGNLLAGILQGYNGYDLSAGDHYLIVRTFQDSILVFHPLGDTSPIHINRPDTWVTDTCIKVHREWADSSRIITATISGNDIQFDLDSTLAHYRITYDTSDVTRIEKAKPVSISSLQSYPNPFYEQTRIIYSISNPMQVEISIYNASGQKIRTLTNEFQESGNHSLVWDAKDDTGMRAMEGLYLIILRAGDDITSTKTILLK